MGSDLLTIARSGANASRAALNITAQNIANASSEGYVRRSIGLSELSAYSGMASASGISLAGVRVSGIVRNADLFRQAEVRRTGSDAARAGAELQGLENIEAALEQTQVFDSIVAFEGSLQQLVSDPTDGSLRAAVIESGRTLAQTFNVAASSLEAVGAGLRFEAANGVEEVNRISGELARVNLRLSRVADASSDQTTLLDQRDSLLQQLSEHVDVTTSFAADTTVTVTIGGTPGGTLVQGGTTNPLAMATAANGTISFTLGGSALAPASGSLAGQSLALSELDSARTRLDDLATGTLGIATTLNAAQIAGVDLDGNPGQPLFSGTGAADLTLVATSGNQIATAPAGATPNSRDSGNLVAMRNTFATNDPAGAMDALLFDVSSAVAGRTITGQALDSIASTALIALQAQAGVDLDQEAVNLVRYQQAFQASGRVMQVASDLFDTILGIR